jgi:hypothetical protein
MVGFTLDEVLQLVSDSQKSLDNQGGEPPIWLERKWKEDPWQRLVVIRTPDATHPYTVFKELEDSTWSIDLIYPSVGEIICHYRILGGVRLSKPIRRKTSDAQKKETPHPLP